MNCPECGSEMLLMSAVNDVQPGLSPVPERYVCVNYECGYEEKLKDGEG